MADPKRRMSSAQRREQLLTQSKELFAQRGYHDASTNQLALNAGVTEPVLYSHFQSKKNLFISVLQEFGERFEASWKETLDQDTTSTPIELLSRILIEYRRAAQADPDIQKMIFDGFSEARDPEIAHAVKQNFHRFHRYVADLIARAQAAGEIADTVNPEAALWGFTNMTCAIQAMLMLGLETHLDEHCIQEYSTMWINILKK